MIYKVKIVEHLEQEVEVEAADRGEAEEAVRQAYLNDEYDVFTGEVHVDAIGVRDNGEFIPIL